jgi:hypothetical protein
MGFVCIKALFFGGMEAWKEGRDLLLLKWGISILENSGG